MAKTGSSGKGDGGGEARSRSETEAPGPQIDDQTEVGASSGPGAEVPSIVGGNGGHATGAKSSGKGDRREPETQERTPVVVAPGDPQVRRLDPRSGVKALVVTHSGSAGAGGSGAGDGDDQSNGLPRGSESGKAPMVTEDVPREAHTERVEFVPPVGSSGHEPIMSSDLADYVGEAALALLMRENPLVVKVVMTATRRGCNRSPG